MHNPATTRPSFFAEVDILRRDDHRLYHQSRINQTLHLISACVFLVVYVWVWFEPAKASVLGWFGAMWVRQTGHFVFEPRGFDRIHGISNATKERIKVGFNVYRKCALIAVWALIPLLLWLDPTGFGLLAADSTWDVFVQRVGWAWLVLAGAGLLLRTVYLMVARGAQTGLAWLTKILTDPFHNVREYWRSPFYLLRGQLLEPLDTVADYRHHAPAN